MSDGEHSALWPTPRQRLLLRAALIEDARAIEAFHAWRDGMDLDSLENGSARLLPLLHRNLRRLGVEDPLLARIGGTAKFGWVEAQWKFEALRRAIANLAGIPVMLLKGAALVLRGYGDLTLRPMGDCDILVPWADREAALDRMRGAGWRRSDEKVGRKGYSCEFYLPEQRGVEIELHWLSSNESTPRYDAQAWAASQPVEFRGQPCRILCIEDELMHTARHGLSWNATTPIRWLADTAILLRNGPVDWERLTARAQAWECTLALRRTLGWVARNVEAPVPPEVLRELKTAGASLRERRIYRLKVKQKSWQETLALWAAIYERRRPRWIWLLTPAGTLRYFAGQFEVPDERDAAAYFVEHFRRFASERGWVRREALAGELAYCLGARPFEWRALFSPDQARGMIEEPRGRCWARHGIKIEGFYFALDGSPPQAMRVVQDGRPIAAVKNGHARLDIWREAREYRHSLRSGFAVVMDVPVAPARLVIEQREAGRWTPAFELRFL